MPTHYLTARTQRRMPHWIVWPVLWVNVGCEGERFQVARCQSDVPLVISEVRPRAWADEPEWMELYNPSTRPLSLNGLTVDVSAQRTSLRSAGQLQAQAFGVIAFTRTKRRPPYFYTFSGEQADRLLVLPDGGATVRISCDGTLLDEVVVPPVPTVSSGEAGHPSWQKGHEGEGFCWTNEPFAPTPGELNLPCGQARCVEEISQSRSVVSPRFDDLVVRAVLSDPKGDDRAREWLLLQTRRAVDLNQLVVRVNDAIHRCFEGVECVPAEASAWVLLGTNVSPLEGSVAVIVGACTPPLSLPNRAFELALSVPAAEGAPPGPTYSIAELSSDEVQVWEELDGEHQLECTLNLSEVNTSTGLHCGGLWCDDPSSGPTPLRSTARDGWVISEILFPADAGGPRWVEVHNTADEPRLLNGLILVVGPHSLPIVDRECLSVPPGAFALIGNATVESVVTVPDTDDLWSDLRLDSSVSVAVAVDDRVLDQVELVARDDFVAWGRGDDDLFCPEVYPSKHQADAHVDPSDPLTPVLGSPGEGSRCERRCGTADQRRAAVVPTAESLEVTELFADPSGPDACRDYLEITNRGAVRFDLAGLTLVVGNRTWDLPDSTCGEVEPGRTALLVAEHREDLSSIPLDCTPSTMFPIGPSILSIRLGDQTIAELSYGPARVGKAEHFVAGRSACHGPPTPGSLEIPCGPGQ